MKQVSAMTGEMASLKLQLARLTSGSDRAFYVCDTATRRRFLVDTGAQISVIPPTSANRRFPSPGLYLQAANCSAIPIFARLSLNLNIGLRRSFTWVFVIADVPHKILCSGFLGEFGLHVDCQHARLLDRTTGLSFRGLAPFTAPTNLSVLDTDIASPYRELLLRHPKIINPQFRSGEVQHDVDSAEALFGKAVFSKIDLTFQRSINHILRGQPFVYAYTDDLLVASRNEEEHKEHLALVFDRLDKFAVVVDPSKCVLGVPSLKFLGHQVDSEGLRPLPSKVEAVRNFPPPTSKRRLQRFLGMVNFYRRFLPNCADPILPLTNRLSGPKGPLELTGESLTAFERIKNFLADATLITHPAPEVQLSLMVDAFTVGVSAVLQQHLADSTRPLDFFFKKRLPVETRYSIFGHELLAIYLAAKHFRHFLEGRCFTVFTDHRPLTFALRSHSDKYNPSEIAHLDYISQFSTDIRHIDGTKNEVADMLSRPPLSSLQLPQGIDLCAMTAEQQRVSCPGDESVSGFQLKEVPLTTGSGTVLCDVTTPFHRPFISTSMRRAVFQNLRRLSHPGIRTFQKILTESFVWHGMTKEVKALTRSCLNYQRSKVQRHNKSTPGTFPSPDARFSHVHLDVVGPLPPSNGFTHLLTCVDRYIRWAEAIPLSNAQAETIVKAFV
nr:unnamed protein product [Spirometra erinaceieuropaei]